MQAFGSFLAVSMSNVIPFPGRSNPAVRDLWQSLSGDLIERYLDARCFREGLTRAGQQSFRDDLRNFDAWMLRSCQRTLVTAQAADVKQFIRVCASSSLSTRSILSLLASVRGFYEFLREGGIRRDNPVQDLLDSLQAGHTSLLASSGRP